MMRAKCGRCHWEFDTVAIPGPALDVANAMQRRAVCPLCTSGQTFLANSRPLTADEIAAKGLGPLGAASTSVPASNTEPAS